MQTNADKIKAELEQRNAQARGNLQNRGWYSKESQAAIENGEK